jgi:hypothetical protein
MAKIDLHPGETEIGAWPLFYLPPYGGKFSGTITITDRRLVYVASDDASLGGVLTHKAASGRLEIAKADIRDIEVMRGFFHKRVLLTLADGSFHLFDRGAMSIDKVAEAMASPPPDASATDPTPIAGPSPELHR